jgi:DNA-binding MarR family transcriptional regulator
MARREDTMSGEPNVQKGNKLKKKTTDAKEESKDDSAVMKDMFQAMIPLLGKLEFPPEQLQLIVMRNKRNPLDYIKAYNLCDGEHTMSEIATAINVKPGTLSPILADWKDLGIVYEVTRKNGRFYQRLYKLDVPKSKKSKVEAEEKGEIEEPVIVPAIGEEKSGQQ